MVVILMRPKLAILFVIFVKIFGIYFNFVIHFVINCSHHLFLNYDFINVKPKYFFHCFLLPFIFIISLLVRFGLLHKYFKLFCFGLAPYFHSLMLLSTEVKLQNRYQGNFILPFSKIFFTNLKLVDKLQKMHDYIVYNFTNTIRYHRVLTKLFCI